MTNAPTTTSNYRAIGDTTLSRLLPRTSTQNVIHRPVGKTQLATNHRRSQCCEATNISHIVNCQDSPRTPLCVHCTSHRLKMVWVYARAITAQVIGLKSNWDKAVRTFITPTMGWDDLSFNDMATVAIVRNRVLPNPARRFVAAILDNVQRSGVLHPVTLHIAAVMPFVHAASGGCTSSDRGLLATPAKAQARWIRVRGKDRMVVHSTALSSCAVPAAVQAARRFSLSPLYQRGQHD